MTVAEDILQFYFSTSSLKLSAQNIIPKSLEEVKESNIDKLQRITEEIGASAFIFSGHNQIPEVYRKFKKHTEDSNIYFERKELRTLTYSLLYSERNSVSIFNNTKELNHAFTLLDTNWKDAYLIGLVDCLLKNWETTQNDSLNRLQQYIFEKIDSYNGGRTTLISFKKNKRFFSVNNGDLILGDTAAKLNAEIFEITKFLNLPNSWFGYSYFSKVITTYYERNKNQIVEKIDDLILALGKHNNSVTYKRLVSKIIIQTTQHGFEYLQDKIKNIAFKHIGDPNNSSNWVVFDNATESESKEINQARKILNEWITQQFINVFFNICINDNRRRTFWLNLSPHVLSFKVYGPLHTKYKLEKDERISEYVNARFEIIPGRRDISAFILYIGDYMLIEFSKDGYAFQAYKINSLERPNLNHQINSIDELRNPSMPWLIHSDDKYDYYEPEGRLAHRDGNEKWENKFYKWINKIVLK